MNFGLWTVDIICWSISLNYLSEFREDFVCSRARHLVFLFLVVFEIDVV